jgi:hypothetical protein
VSGILARLGRGEDAQAITLRLLAALRPGLQADPDVDARVPQRKRVRVPLAAVAEDGDVPLLDQREVGVVVVEDLCHFDMALSSSLRIKSSNKTLLRNSTSRSLPWTRSTNSFGSTHF